MMVWIALAAAADTEFHLAQARQFAKNKWYEDAAKEIEQGLASGGDQSFDLHWLGAQVYYELNRVDRARALADRAVDLAPAAAIDQATAFRDFLATTFGSLTLEAPYPGMRSRLQLEVTSTLLDPELKKLVNRLALELRDATDLPVTIWLPEGEYLVNGQAIAVNAGGESRLPLDLRQLGARGLAALQVSRLELAFGTVVMFGPDVPNLRPGGAAELSFTQPLGPVLLGALVGWDARTWSGGSGETVFDPLAIDGGLRIGREIVLGGPLAMRTSLGVRYGLVPGIGVECGEGDGGMVCPAEVVDYELYVPGRAVSPFGELAIEYREAGRSTALGVGVKLVVAESFGTLPETGTASLPDGSQRDFALGGDDTWMATAIRIYTNFDMAF